MPPGMRRALPSGLDGSVYVFLAISTCWLYQGFAVEAFVCISAACVLFSSIWSGELADHRIEEGKPLRPTGLTASTPILARRGIWISRRDWEGFGCFATAKHLGARYLPDGAHTGDKVCSGFDINSEAQLHSCSSAQSCTDSEI